MKKMKALNNYAGLGGNRKLWQGVEVTAVELNASIAAFYQNQFKSDRVIIGDAHKYLLKNYREFEFVWSSVPCPSHSRARFWKSKGGGYDPVYPDMMLYEEIIFLDKFFEGEWVVENVTPYYEPLIKPTAKIGRHLFWASFDIPPIEFGDADIQGGKREDWQKLHGFDISGYKFTTRTDKILRNCVNPKLGEYIFKLAKGCFEKEPLPANQHNQIRLF